MQDEQQQSAELQECLPMLSGLASCADTIAQQDAELGSVMVSALSDLEEKIALLVKERDGMADELLVSYEQLAIVFDVTRRLFSLGNENNAPNLFVETLRTTYPDVQFVIVREAGRPHPDGGGLGSRFSAEDGTALPDWLLSGVCEACEGRAVCVAHSTEVGGQCADGSLQHLSEALIAPVFAGKTFACAIVLWRGSGAHGMPPVGFEGGDEGERRGGVRPWQSGEMQLFDSLSSFCGDAIRNIRLVQELRQVSMEMVRTMVNAVDQKDPYTSGHSNRVGYYATMLGRAIGMERIPLRWLEWSALLHDVGKIGIRDEVLKKTGKLTPEEFEHIKEHPERGYSIVRENPNMKNALDGVLHHHERYDGKGYPKGLSGTAIPLQARIIQVADIFDALTTTRSYRDAYSWEEALGILEKEAGSVVDPELCRTFVGLMRELYRKNPAAFEAIGKTDETVRLEG